MILKTNLLLAWRNLCKQPGVSLISLFSLTIGLALALTLCSYALHEYSYDQSHEDAEYIYTLYSPGFLTHGLPSYQGTTLAEANKHTADPLPYAVIYSAMLEADIDFHSSKVSTVAYPVSNTFFSIFTFKFIEGSRDPPFGSANGVVISDKLARRLFWIPACNRPNFGCGPYSLRAITRWRSLGLSQNLR